jgi:transcriptional regulator with XRE-family HTH domain
MSLGKRRTKLPGQIGYKLRHQLACSQEEMASFLEVDRRYLAMIESGRRVMPDLAWFIYNELQIQMDKEPPETCPALDEIIAKQQEEQKVFLEKQIWSLNYHIAFNDRKLKRFERQYDILCQAIKKLSAIQFVSTDVNKPPYMQWPDQMLKERLSDLEGCSLSKQSELRQKLIGLHAQLANCNQLLGVDDQATNEK